MTIPPTMTPEKIARETDARADEHALLGRIVRDIKQMFGPPPIVLGEDPKDFDRILFGLVRTRHPDDFRHKLYIWDIATEVLLGRRLDRVCQLTLDRKLRKIVHLQKARAKVEAQRKKEKQDAAESRAEFESAADFTAAEKRIDQLATIIEETPDDVDGVLDRAALQAEIDRAFQQDMPFHIGLDDMKSRSYFRRNISIEMWQTHRLRFTSPLTLIQQREEDRIRRQDEQSWRDEMIADMKASQLAQTESPSTQPDQPPVVAEPEGQKP
jgi:hypothetical protein